MSVPLNQRGLVFGSVCSGIESASAAWEPLGWRAAFFSEIEKFPRAVLEHRCRAVDARRTGASGTGVPLLGDFTTIRPRHLRRIGVDTHAIDVLVGGTPCQDFSVAGMRTGLDGSRGNLTLEYFRLARRLRSPWMVWENVPGVLSLDGGRAFGLILAAAAGYPPGTIFEPPKGGWRSAGIVEPRQGGGGGAYGLCWRVLDAQYFGVPQRRTRVFIVGYLGDWRPAAAVLVERESLSGHRPSWIAARSRAAAPASRRSPGKGFWRQVAEAFGLRRVSVGAGIEVISSLTASHGGADDNDAQAGHLVAFGGNNTAGPIDIAACLNAHGGGSRRMDFESETFVASALRARDGSRGVDSDCTDTLVAHTLRGDGFDASEDGTGRGTPLVAVPIGFNSRQDPSSAEGVAPSIGAKDNGGGIIGPTTAVRRLTPRECERLQGFPDDWTRVPNYRAKVNDRTRLFASFALANGMTVDEAHQEIADYYGISRAELRSVGVTPDGPRYKACGNSKATVVVQWIGLRLAHVDAMVRQREGVSQ